MDIRSLTSPAPGVFSAPAAAQPQTDGLNSVAMYTAENAALRRQVGTLTVRNPGNQACTGQWLNKRCVCATQIENTALKARMSELEEALQGASQTLTQAVQAAQIAQVGQRAAEDQLLQAQQAAKAAHAHVVHTAQAAQTAQLAQAVGATQTGQRAQAGLERPRAGTSRQPDDAMVATSNIGQPLQTQRSRSTPAPEEHERRASAKKPRIAKETSSSSSPQPPQQRARSAAAATAACLEAESSVDDVTSPAQKSLEQSQTIPLIIGSRGRARVGGSRITALAAEGDYLFAAGVDSSLWKCSLSSRSSNGGAGTGWEHIGSAVNVVAMATLDRHVYALDASSSVWCLDLYGSNPTWELWDDPPPPIKQHGIELPERRVSLTTTPDGYIWVATLSNKLLRASVNQSTNVRYDDARKAVCWERIRESVGVAGLVVIPSGSRALSSNTDCLLIAACEDSKMWHWKPPRAVGHDSLRNPLPNASHASIDTREKAWCSCGATPAKADRGVAYSNGSVYVTGPNGIHVAEVGHVQEGVPTVLEWSSGQVPLPPITINAGAGSLTDRYSPSREEAKPQRLGKEAAEVRGSRETRKQTVKETVIDESLSWTHKAPAAIKKTGKSLGRKSAETKPQAQLKSPDGKEYFEVERILDKRPVQGRKQAPGAPASSMFEYKVKWLNFDKPSDNTWEPWENVCNCREVLAAYEAAVNGAADNSNTRMRVGGKKPRSTGVRNTVTGSGFVGGKRPRSSSSDESGACGSTSEHGSHNTASRNSTVGDDGARPSGTSTSTAQRTQVTGHTVQRPRAQRLANTAALHPSVAAEYQQAEAEAEAEADAQTRGTMPTVRTIAAVPCRSFGSVRFALGAP
jgi:hypothetical protein